MIKCELLVGGYAYDVTDFLVNWDDVEMTWKRQDLDGVVRSFTTKFEFSGEGYSLLVGEWLKNYLSSSASVVFYTRNNSWLWNERFRCSLDFSTFSYDGHTCEINAIDDSLAALIKAKRGTQYEYSVDVIKEESLLRYDRLEMQNKVEWIVYTDESRGTNYVKVRGTSGGIPLYISVSEIASPNIIEIYDGDNFMKNISSSDIPIHLQISFSVKTGYDNAAGGGGMSFYGRAELSFSDGSIAASSSYFELGYSTTSHRLTISYDGVLPSDMSASLKLRSYSHSGGYGGDGANYDLEIYDITPLTLSSSTIDSPLSIPVVTPVKLLNRLLKSINGGQDGLTGTIASDERLDKTVLLAAESVRGLKNAKLYSSYKKFCDWMNAEFGFVPVVGDKSVHFVHRDSLFSDTIIKELDGVTDFEYSVDAGMIYSRVNVGYDKVDYESVNGKDEFRFTQQYTTGVTLVDGSLDLTSPYRADSYGIEFLASSRGEETTDSESDNDVFMVGAVLTDGVYIIDRSTTIEGVLSPSTMFNGLYSQLDMIRSNARYLASFSETLEFASSDGNSDVTIDGVSLSSDVDVSDRLFTAGHISVTTGDTDIPSNLNGTVCFPYNGKTYKGYVREVSLNIGRRESVTYKLISKSVE